MFWKITVDGSNTTVCLRARHGGFFGDHRTTQSTQHEDDDTADTFSKEQIAEKLKEGYSVVVAGDEEASDDDTGDEKTRPEIAEASVDHLLVAVAFNRTEEVKAFLAENVYKLSGDRLLVAVYAAMMCGNDVIAHELCKFLASNVERTNPSIEPVLYLCWTLLCAGWCDTSWKQFPNLQLSVADMKNDTYVPKFKLQHLDQGHDSKVAFFETLNKFGLDSDCNYDQNPDYWEHYNGGYADWHTVTVDRRHIVKPKDDTNTTLTRESFVYNIRLKGMNGFQREHCENIFVQAKLWKRVVDEEFGAQAQRLPSSDMYVTWQEWWINECAIRPSNESIDALLCFKSLPGVLVETLVGIVSALPPHPASAAIKQRVADKVWAAFDAIPDKTSDEAKELIKMPHWQIANPNDYTRLVRDLMNSQSSNWVTSSPDIRAAIIVMAGLDVFVRSASSLASETDDQRVGSLASLTKWPSISPLAPIDTKLDTDDARAHTHPRWRTCPIMSEIDRGLIFVGDCDPDTFDKTDIPPTGLLPMHTLIAHRVKSQFGKIRRSGVREEYVQTADGRPFMVNATSTVDLASGRTHVKLTANLVVESPPIADIAAHGWKQWPSQQVADSSLDNMIAQAVNVRRCQELHAKWMHNALDEHASVAAFSKFILELLVMGAPPCLLERAHLAAMQEIDHARLCVMMASEYADVVNHSDVGVRLNCDIGRLPDFSLSVNGSISDIALNTMLEGAVGETLAALQLAIRLDASGDESQGRLRSVLTQLMHDETSHGALAWTTLRWMLVNRDGDGDASRAVQTALGTMSRKYAPGHRQAALEYDSLVQDGFVRDDLTMSLEALCFWEVIKPLAELIIDVGADVVEWQLEAGGLRKLAPASMEVVLDEMVFFVRSLAP
jgi:hypothetical protein